MTISGVSSDTTIAQTKLYLDEVRKITGEASSTPTATASTSAVTDTKGALQPATAASASSTDNYNVYIKSDLSNVVGYSPASASAAQPPIPTSSAESSSQSPAEGTGPASTPVPGTTGPASFLPAHSGSTSSGQGTSSTQTSNSQMAGSTQGTSSTQDNTSAQDGDSDDMKAYSLLVNDLTMLASLIQSGDMPNARTTAGTVIKDLNNYLDVPSQNPPSANGQTPKFVVQNFSSLLASVQEGDKASASTIVNAIKVLS